MVEIKESPLEDAAEVSRALSRAVTTGMVTLTFQGLALLPSPLFKMQHIVRLDLGWNELRELPPEIGLLSKLESLWCQSNPLAVIPPEIEGCTKLRVLDLRETAIVRLPRELGRLEKVHTIDLRGAVSLKPKLKAAIAEGGTVSLMEHLKRKDVTKQLKIELEARFREGIYRETVDTEVGSEKVRQLVKRVFREFTDNDEMRNLIRNCERLFPANIDKANVHRLHAKFVELRRQNERKKLAAELELKLRVIYFDRINPASVEGIVHSIYAEIESLADVQFLIKHAPKLFPANAVDIVASQVKTELVALQKRMAEERAAAMALVDKELCSLYPHLEPKIVRELTEAVSAFFKRVEDLKKLAADASLHFPAEFETAMSEPKAVRIAFVRAAKESAGVTK